VGVVVVVEEEVVVKLAPSAQTLPTPHEEGRRDGDGEQ
jgi:hypothetical protein